MKQKLIIKVVDKCGDCPLAVDWRENEFGTCSYMIPPQTICGKNSRARWCPLPDYSPLENIAESIIKKLLRRW